MRKFHRKPRVVNPIITRRVGERWQMDLVDFSKLARQNRGTSFLLTIIDLFSKKAIVKPLRSKSAWSVSMALEEALLETPANERPRTLQSDRGSEFRNYFITRLCKKFHIKQAFSKAYTPQSQGAVEKFNGILKNLINHYLLLHQTRNYLPVLQLLVANYNSTKHSFTNLPPNEAQQLTEGPDFARIQELQSNKEKGIWHPHPLQRGDTVRILMKSLPYYKENTLQKPPTVWTKDLFRVKRVLPRDRYLLSDNTTYSGWELQKITNVETLPKVTIRTTSTKRKLDYILPATTLLEDRTKRQRKPPSYLEDYTE